MVRGTELKGRQCVVAVSGCCGNVWVTKTGVWRVVCDEVEREGKLEPLQPFLVAVTAEDGKQRLV